MQDLVDRSGNGQQDASLCGPACVNDPTRTDSGMCVAKAQATNLECRPYDHLGVVNASRFGQPTVKADVCLPKSGGWVGDDCAIASDCRNGTTCVGATATKPGICTMSCDRSCDDQPGYADTFCAAAPSLGAGGSCLRQCTPASNAAECPRDQSCVSLGRNGMATTVRNVCVPTR